MEIVKNLKTSTLLILDHFIHVSDVNICYADKEPL